tara:strand:- start:78 stop:218 length:141 start_codon:yes stop_codon:yes gene_type:complete
MHDLNRLHEQIKLQELLIKDLKEQNVILRRTILFYENRKIVCLSNS